MVVAISKTFEIKRSGLGVPKSHRHQQALFFPCLIIVPKAFDSPTMLWREFNTTSRNLFSLDLIAITLYQISSFSEIHHFFESPTGTLWRPVLLALGDNRIAYSPSLRCSGPEANPA
ncbi:MAG: hypothetical protein U1E47_02765 [Rivihabitans pingtungensis]